MHPRPVHDDPEEPRPGGAGFPELADLAPGDEGSLLNGILGLLPVAENGKGDVVRRLDQGTYELLEESSIAERGAPGLGSLVQGSAHQSGRPAARRGRWTATNESAKRHDTDRIGGVAQEADDPNTIGHLKGWGPAGCLARFENLMATEANLINRG
jgi:hypothetical protein